MITSGEEVVEGAESELLPHERQRDILSYTARIVRAIRLCTILLSMPSNFSANRYDIGVTLLCSIMDSISIPSFVWKYSIRIGIITDCMNFAFSEVRSVAKPNSVTFILRLSFTFLIYVE